MTEVGVRSLRFVVWGPEQSGKSWFISAISERFSGAPAAPIAPLRPPGAALEQVYWDELPFSFPLRDTRLEVMLYGPPGHPDEDLHARRAALLREADGVLFVADSAPHRMHDNEVSLLELQRAMSANRRGLDSTALVFIHNKRDLPSALDIGALEAKLNPLGFPSYPAVANRGEGAMDALKGILKIVLARMPRDVEPVTDGADEEDERDTNEEGEATTEAPPESRDAFFQVLFQRDILRQKMQYGEPCMGVYLIRSRSARHLIFPPGLRLDDVDALVDTVKNRLTVPVDADASELLAGAIVLPYGPNEVYVVAETYATRAAASFPLVVEGGTTTLGEATWINHDEDPFVGFANFFPFDR